MPSPGLLPGYAPRPERAEPRPILVIAALNLERSSALSIASGDAPINSQLNFFQHAVAMQIECAIQRGLTTPWSARSRPDVLWQMITFHHPARRSAPGKSRKAMYRIGHDRGWIAVNQNNFVTFFAQGLTCLRAGVIKLTRLTTDDDRAGTYDQKYFLYHYV